MTIVVKDTATRANTTASPTGLGNTETGQTWVQLKVGGGCTPYINNNQIVISGASDGGMIANAGVSDAIVQADFIFPAGGQQLVFRAGPSNSQYFFVEYTGTGLDIYIYSGGWSNIGTTPVTLVSGDTIKVKCQGTTITVYKNSTQLTSVTSSFNQTATYFGMAAGAGSPIYDNFQVDDMQIDTGGNAYTKTLSDTITGSETIVKAPKKSLPENVTLSEVLTKAPKKSAADAITITETVVKKRTFAIIDTVNTSDSFTKLTGKAVILSDAIAITETIRKTSSKVQNDTITGSDGENKAAAKRINDTLTPTDAISTIGGKLVLLSDSITLSDGAIKKALSKFQADAITGTDGEQKAANRKINDAIAASDALSVFNGKTVILNDAVSFTDTIRKSVVKSKLETLGITETAARGANISVKLFDVVVLSDAINVLMPNKPIYKQLIKGDLIINRMFNGEIIVNRKSNGETIIIRQVKGDLFL
jgi:hypothetical protein